MSEAPTREECKKITKRMDLVKQLIELRKEYWADSEASWDAFNNNGFNQEDRTEAVTKTRMAQEVTQVIEGIFREELSKLGFDKR